MGRVVGDEKEAGVEGERHQYTRNEEAREGLSVGEKREEKDEDEGEREVKGLCYHNEGEEGNDYQERGGKRRAAPAPQSEEEWTPRPNPAGNEVEDGKEHGEENRWKRDGGERNVDENEQDTNAHESRQNHQNTPSLMCYTVQYQEEQKRKHDLHPIQHVVKDK